MDRDLIKKLLCLSKDFLANLLNQKINFYAASMSWATIFFMIPFLVITFSITLHMPIFTDYYGKIYQFITSNLMPTTDSELIVSWIDKFVKNASRMGYVGIAYVILAALLFFKDFDYIVNDIFATKQRNFFNMFIFYTMLLLLIPTTLSVSLWFLMLIGSKIYFSQIVLQFLIVWFIIFIIYKFTPKENLQTRVVVITSFLATSIWSIAKTLFMLYIGFNKTYTTIYGAVSIIIFLFLWIYISWVIFLYGLQMSAILNDKSAKKCNEM